MLKRLYIKNFTLIDELDIDLYQGFSVITGETGALNVGYHNISDPAYASAYTVSAALDLIIENMKEVYCTMEQYQEWVDAGTIDPDTKYYIYEE